MRDKPRWPSLARSWAALRMTSCSPAFARACFARSTMSRKGKTMGKAGRSMLSTGRRLWYGSRFDIQPKSLLALARGCCTAACAQVQVPDRGRAGQRVTLGTPPGSRGWSRSGRRSMERRAGLVDGQSRCGWEVEWDWRRREERGGGVGGRSRRATEERWQPRPAASQLVRRSPHAANQGWVACAELVGRRQIQ